MPGNFCDCSRFTGDFHLVRSARDAYHPRFVGTLCGALREAERRCAEDRAGVSVLFHPPGAAPAAARVVARIPWSGARNRCLPPRILRDLCAGGGGLSGRAR